MTPEKITGYLVGLAWLLQADTLLEREFDAKPGFRSDNATLKSVSAGSQIECAASCAREPICSGYNYHGALTDQCQLLCGVGDETAQAGWTVGYLQENKGRIKYP